MADRDGVFSRDRAAVAREPRRRRDLRRRELAGRALPRADYASGGMGALSVSRCRDIEGSFCRRHRLPLETHSLNFC